MNLSKDQNMIHTFENDGYFHHKFSKVIGNLENFSELFSETLCNPENS